jgi:hypothetical protein
MKTQLLTPLKMLMTHIIDIGTIIARGVFPPIILAAKKTAIAITPKMQKFNIILEKPANSLQVFFIRFPSFLQLS